MKPTPMTVHAVPGVPVDMREVDAQLHVEVAPDGSVLVHGIPDDLPDDLGLQVAQVAAEAATDRLERILLRKPFVNRDDRRLLTRARGRRCGAEGWFTPPAEG